MEGSSYSNKDCDEKIVLVIPYQKQELLKSELQPLNVDLPHSSVNSMNEGCESPLSSWDSEPETDIIDMAEQNQFVGVENTDDGFLWEMDNRSYDELLKKFIAKEEELRVSNFKLQLSEQEIIKLNVQVENSEDQLHNVREQLKLKEEELHKQKEHLKEEIFKLKSDIEKNENQLHNMQKELKVEMEMFQKRIAELHSLFPVVVKEINNSAEQLEVAQEKLKISKDEIENLRKELESKSSESHQLQNQLKVAQKTVAQSKLELDASRKHIEMQCDLFSMYENNAANHQQAVKRLKSKILDLQDKFSSEKGDLHFKILSLSNMETKLTYELEDCQSRNKDLENKLRQHEAEKFIHEKLHATQQMALQDEIHCLRMQLTSELEDCQSRNKELENKLRQQEAENVKQEKLHATQKMALEDEIRCLREELGQKSHYEEAANKVFEKITAMIDKLKVEFSSRDDTLLNMKKHMKELTKMAQDEFKLKMADLQKKVSQMMRKNAVTSDSDEEKS